jgi:hypothetical protein
VPAATEEKRYDAYVTDTLPADLAEHCRQIRYAVLEKRQNDKTTGDARRNALAQALERLGPARIARTVRVEDDGGVLVESHVAPRLHSHAHALRQ